MKQNFKVIRVEVIGGKSSIVACGLSEGAAWGYAFKLEEKQSGLKVRVVWYAVTSSQDWQGMAKTFWEMRRSQQPTW